MKKIILFSLITLSLFLISMEVLARLYQSYRGRTIADSIFSPVYRHYYFLGPSFKPNSSGTFQAIQEMKINSLGFRGDEFTINKKKNHLRIITFGGSTSHSGNYPEKLSAMLNKKHKSKYDKIEIINAAVPTWNTTQSLIQFITRAIYLKPDIIIVYHSINDYKMDDFYWLYHLPEIDFEEYGGFLRNHSQLYCFIRNKVIVLMDKIKISLWQRDVVNRVYDIESFSKREITTKDEEWKTSTQVFKMDMKHFIALTKFYGIKTVFVTMPLNHDPKLDFWNNLSRAGYAYRNFEDIVKKVNLYNSVLRKLSVEHNILLIDAADSDMNKNSDYFSDLCHFSEKGAYAFADFLNKELDVVISTPVFK